MGKAAIMTRKKDKRAQIHRYPFPAVNRQIHQIFLRSFFPGSIEAREAKDPLLIVAIYIFQKLNPPLGSVHVFPLKREEGGRG